MKKLSFLLLLAMVAMAAGAQQFDDDLEDDTLYYVLEDTVNIVHTINQEQFKVLIADWSDRQWKMRSERPVVIDFYAEWCAPCKRLEPRLRQIAQIYRGEVDFYRIDVDKNPQIAETFQIRNIPYLLICPLEGQLKSVIGLFPMNEYIRVINQALGR